MLTALTHHRVDPTRTLTLRTQYARAMRRRFVALRRALRTSVVERDAFGRQPRPTIFQAAPERAWDFPTEAAMLVAFLGWLDRQIDTEILEVDTREGTQVTQHRHWQDTFLRQAYLTGILAARRQLQRAGVPIDMESQLFGGLLTIPMHAQRLDLLTVHAFEDLQGITAAMRQAISRAAATGLAQEASPEPLATELSAPIAAIGARRAEQLARTGVIAAVAEAVLTEAQRHGVDAVRVEPEYIFTTVADSRVCPRCSALEGKTFSISKARGMIPQHSGCRCAWSIS
jgi:SPP1 gp7 family putative phage head morphogenesis protein